MASLLSIKAFRVLWLKLPSLIPIVLLWACVDRVNINFLAPKYYPIVINGYISDEDEPQQVFVARAHDLESVYSPRVSISVKRMVLKDNFGNADTLSEIRVGAYQTNPDKIRGVIGRVYTLHVSLLDGREFYSTPDTLLPNGSMDSIYFNFRTDKINNIDNYSFDVFFNATATANSDFYLWKFIGTYKANIPCCICWAFLRNPIPNVADRSYVNGKRYLHELGGNVPVNGYTFMNKVYAQVKQVRLTKKSYKFWKEIRDQLQASGSLFQPVTGKISLNYISANDGSPEQDIYGLFYAGSVVSKGVYIKRADVPRFDMIPTIQFAPSTGSSCQDFFPRSTNIQPSYWTD